MGQDFTHLDESGRAQMVDVSPKRSTARRAVARTRVVLSAGTFDKLKTKALPKGDALTTSRVAGIMAAKRTSELIPLCHPLPLAYIDVDFDLDEEGGAVVVTAEVRTTAETGVEMEALTAAQVAALTIYDFCKAVQKDVVITDCRLVFKSGGKSGPYSCQD
jgi:cyclic pyranopterin phosphate synthase